jgi:predicted small secreted protein
MNLVSFGVGLGIGVCVGMFVFAWIASDTLGNVP